MAQTDSNLLGGSGAQIRTRRYGEDPYDVEGEGASTSLPSDFDAALKAAVQYAPALGGSLAFEALQIPEATLPQILARWLMRSGTMQLGSMGGKTFAEMVNAPPAVGSVLGSMYGNSAFETADYIDMAKQGSKPTGPWWGTPRIPGAGEWSAPNIKIPSYEGPDLPPLRQTNEPWDVAHSDLEWEIYKQRKLLDDMMRKFPWLKDKLSPPP